MTDGQRNRFFWISALVATVVSGVHAIVLPLCITYDGIGYLDLADVLGSDRFPEEWASYRYPLFPLYLKAILFLFGRQANALVAGMTAIGVATILLVGFSVRRLVGPKVAGASMVLLAVYPTFVAYQHLVLTEIGTAFFLSLFVAILLWPFHGRGPLWKRTAALILALVFGNFWRSSLMALAAVVALAHGLLGYAEEDKVNNTRGRFRLLVAQMLLVAIVPALLSTAWTYTDASAFREVVLRKVMIKQLLPPENHPIMGPYSSDYRKAISESYYEGNLYSGLREDHMLDLLRKVFAQPSVRNRRPSEVFRELVVENPGRYLQGVFRTFMLFGGAKAQINQNHNLRTRVLGMVAIKNRMSHAPARPELSSRIRETYSQPSSTSAVSEFLNTLIPGYDLLIIVGNSFAVFGLLAGVILRNWKLLVFCAVPLAFASAHAVLLASIDRYVFPAYPLTLVNILVLPVIIWPKVKSVISRVLPVAQTYMRKRHETAT